MRKISYEPLDSRIVLYKIIVHDILVIWASRLLSKLPTLSNAIIFPIIFPTITVRSLEMLSIFNRTSVKFVRKYYLFQRENLLLLSSSILTSLLRNINI